MFSIIKRTASLVLALLMALCLALPALATTTDADAATDAPADIAASDTPAVIEGPLLEKTGRASGRAITLTFSEPVEGILTKEDILITIKGKEAPIAITRMVFPGDGTKVAIEVSSIFNPFQIYSVTCKGVTLDFSSDQNNPLNRVI